MRIGVRLFALAIAVACAAVSFAQNEPLPRMELSKRGKAATALLEIKAGSTYATAFAVHSSGLFVTTEHVVRELGAGKTVQLILDPGLKSQRVLKAAVVRSDRDADLALLRAEGVTDLPVLPFGSGDDVTELMEVVAFGFPFGAALALAKDEYPSMSVNAGSVTSLRRKAGEVFLIQLDAALNPGNAGGPVLDRTGKVVGVVTAGVKGSGVNFAIPINQVSRFLAKPDLQFTPPVVTRANCGTALAFEARAVPVLPSKSALEMELILRGPDGKERKHRLERKGDVYRVSAVPAPSAEAPRLQATVTFSDGSATGTVADQAVTVGGQKVNLSAIRTLRFRPKPQVQLHDGKTLDGAPDGLESLELLFDDKPIRLKLGDAAELRLEPPRDGVEVAYTLVVTQGGKEVARQEGRLGDAGTTPIHASTSPRITAVQAPKLTEEKEIRKLPAPVGDVCVGGGGRFLILHVPNLRQLAIFDVNTAQVVKYLSVAEDNVKFAAGLDKLFVALPNANVLQRWSLTTFEREVTVPNPVTGQIFSLAMGSASRDPLVVGIASAGAGYGPTMTLLDPRTFKPSEYQLPQHIGFGQHADRLRVSTDGSVITGHGALVREGKMFKMYGMPPGALPAPDGRTLYTPNRLYTAQGKPVGSETGNSGAMIWYVPAVQGPLYLSLNQTQQAGSTYLSLKVHLTGDGRPLVTFPKLDALEGLVNWGTGQVSTFDRHVFLIPEARLMVFLPSTNDRLVLHRFDLDELLEKAGIDYLFVTSPPVTLAVKGRAYVYPVAVKSKKGGVKFKLEVGPKGMALAPDGQLTWSVPDNFTDAQADVIVTVADATGQEVFHTFKIAIKEKGDPAAEELPNTPVPPPQPRPVDPVRPPEPVAPGKSTPVPANTSLRPARMTEEKEVRQLPAPVSDVCVGGGGRFLILHMPSLHKLAIFDVQETKIVHYVSVAANNVLFAAGMDKLLVVLPDTNIIQRWSLTTFEREVATLLTLKGTVKAATMGSASQGPLLLGGADGPRHLGGLAFLDVNTLKPIELPSVQGAGYGDPVQLRAAPSGTLFTLWHIQGGGGFGCLTLIGGQLKAYVAGQGSPGSCTLGSADGQLVFGRSYTGGPRGIYTSELKPIAGPTHVDNRYLYPAVHGHYYLGCKMEDQHCTPTVYVIGDDRPLVSLPAVEPGWGPHGDERRHPVFNLDKRFHFIPDAKLLITIPVTNDRLLLHRVDVDKALEKSDIDYLLVTSRPEKSAAKGGAYVYPLTVKSRRNPVKYKLESGPKGMAVSDKGELTWQVPPDFTEKETTVIVSVRDTTGQECFHTFTITIRE